MRLSILFVTTSCNNFMGIMRFKHFSILGLSILMLSACAGGGGQQKPVTSSLNPGFKSSAIDRAMGKALAAAEKSGNTQEVLALLQQVHARNPDDAIIAARYGRALREDDQINNSIRVLKPFTSGEKANEEALTEMAMTQLALGDFKAAEGFAALAVEKNEKNARGYLALGTAQDAQGKHQDAEISFREGLKHWQGDASPIMNNLALNLASQGHLEESLSLLEKAQEVSPGRIELERNRRIISTLLETTGPRPPKPAAKPAVKPATKPLNLSEESAEEVKAQSNAG